MSLSRLLAGCFLGSLCILFAGCGPKADMTPLAGVWSNADQSHIVILDTDHGIWDLTLSQGPGPGAAYAATSGSYKAKAADLFEASVGSSSLSLKAPALAGQLSTLTITETVDGKAQASEFHRMATASTPEIKTLGLDKPGTGCQRPRKPSQVGPGQNQPP